MTHWCQMTDVFQLLVFPSNPIKTPQPGISVACLQCCCLQFHTRSFNISLSALSKAYSYQQNRAVMYKERSNRSDCTREKFFWVVDLIPRVYDNWEILLFDTCYFFFLLPLLCWVHLISFHYFLISIQEAVLIQTREPIKRVRAFFSMWFWFGKATFWREWN